MYKDEYIPKLNDKTIHQAVKNYLSDENLKQQVINSYGTIDNWDVSQVTDMNSLFKTHEDFNEDISNWNVSNVQNMEDMFCNAISFNQPLNNWDVSNVTSMKYMFNGAKSFNQPLNNWNVSNVTTMRVMFAYAKSFNQPLNNWNVSNVTTMRAMFAYAKSFNQPLDNWNVSNVSNIKKMFYHAKSFNQPLNNWNVSNVTNMEGLFDSAKSFNQPLDNWNVSNVSNIKKMFYHAESFHQPHPKIKKFRSRSRVSLTPISEMTQQQPSVTNMDVISSRNAFAHNSHNLSFNDHPPLLDATVTQNSISDDCLLSIAFGSQTLREEEETSEVSATTFASRATSAYTAIPTIHGNSRMRQREISARELQAAKKYGAMTTAGEGTWKCSHNGVAIIMDATQKKVVTTYHEKTPPEVTTLGQYFLKINTKLKTKKTKKTKK